MFENVVPMCRRNVMFQLEQVGSVWSVISLNVKDAVASMKQKKSTLPSKGCISVLKRISGNICCVLGLYYNGLTGD